MTEDEESWSIMNEGETEVEMNTKLRECFVLSMIIPLIHYEK
jgi:hypothetical protein